MEKALKTMDIALRARHTALASEFACLATDLRIIKTDPGSGFSRTIEAFCVEPRAEYFSKLLESFKKCCAECAYLVQRDETEPLAPLPAP
jgi:hypothetical protein